MRLFAAILTPLPLLVSWANAQRDVIAQVGSITANTAVISVRCNNEQPSEVRVEYALHARQGSSWMVEGYAPAVNDYTVSFELKNLIPTRRYEYRVECDPLNNIDPPDNTASTYSSRGTFFTSPAPNDGDVQVNFVWGGGLAGNGWGQNPDLSIIGYDNREEVLGGYVVFEIMRQLFPDFAIFQGDMIHADTPILPVQLIDQSIANGNWINDPSETPPGVVAATIDDFRAKWKYNLQDERLLTFLEEVPVYVQWDDGEVESHWFPTDDNEELKKNALEAFYEYNPIMENAMENAPLYYSRRQGKNLEIFFLDLRSEREPNDDNDREYGIKMLGPEQLTWLQDGLKASTATWKVISTPIPISFVVDVDDGVYEGTDSWGQGDSAVLGREKELKYLFDFIQDNNIKNIVFISSDVHHAAAVKYADLGFYEFVAGPLHAGAHGPLKTDSTFGPKVEFQSGPNLHDLAMNLPPPFFQHFGYAIAHKNRKLEISIRDIEGKELYNKLMTPQ